MVKKIIPYGTKLPVYLTEKEVTDIREHTFGTRMSFDRISRMMEGTTSCWSPSASFPSRRCFS